MRLSTAIIIGTIGMPHVLLAQPLSVPALSLREMEEPVARSTFVDYLRNKLKPGGLLFPNGGRPTSGGHQNTAGGQRRPPLRTIPTRRLKGRSRIPGDAPRFPKAYTQVETGFRKRGEVVDLEERFRPISDGIYHTRQNMQRDVEDLETRWLYEYNGKARFRRSDLTLIPQSLSLKKDFLPKKDGDTYICPRVAVHRLFSCLLEISKLDALVTNQVKFALNLIIFSRYSSSSKLPRAYKVVLRQLNPGSIAVECFNDQVVVSFGPINLGDSKRRHRYSRFSDSLDSTSSSIVLHRCWSPLYIFLSTPTLPSTSHSGSILDGVEL
ncbi:hypothetical protein ABKN59_004064 [Abortiporus biennis]